MKFIRYFLLMICLLMCNCLLVLAKGEYATNILVNGQSIQNFEKEKLEYNLDVESSVTSIKIALAFDTNVYQVKTTGDTTNLKYGLNKITFTLTNKEDSKDTKTYVINVTRKDERSNENNLASLTIAGKKVELDEKVEYDVEVDSNLKQVEVKATLKSDKAKFVSGYGERIGSNAVTLKGEKTTFQIKVEAEDEKIKEYIINILRKNLKSSDATLKSLTIDKIPFNFKSNIYEYNLEVSNVSKINIDAILNDEKAMIDYNKEQALEFGENAFSVKVTAEDGTVKNYNFNILMKDESQAGLIKELTIDDVEFTFDPNTFNYELETELTNLNMNVVLTSEDATYEILDSENLVNGSVVRINVKKGEINQTYTFTIKNDIVLEVEENFKDNENTKELNVNDFLKKYEMIIGLFVFGIGLLSLLIAILLRPKKSQIM